MMIFNMLTYLNKLTAKGAEPARPQGHSDGKQPAEGRNDFISKNMHIILPNILSLSLCKERDIG
jgi:hypothetical protein